MILTGSKEFFGQGNDTDYLVFCKLPHGIIFEYARENDTDYFKYSEALTKKAYLSWLQHENKWWMNFAPLVCKDFVEHLKLDIMGEDFEAVHGVIRKAFVFRMSVPLTSGEIEKLLYRVYIFQKIVERGTFNLAEEDLQEALRIKNKIYNFTVLKKLYKFMREEDRFNEVKDRIKWH